MKKRIICTILLICLFASLFPSGSHVVASADNDALPTIQISSEEVPRGDEIAVSVNIENNPGVMALTFELDYDKSRLNLVGIEDSGLTNWTYEKKAVWVGMEDSYYNGEILKLIFHAIGNAPLGIADVSLACSAYNEAEEAVAFSVGKGGITVISENSGLPSVSLNMDYMILKPEESKQVNVVLNDVDWADLVTWHVEDIDGNVDETAAIISVDETGVVTAHAEGIGFVVGEITLNESTCAARCRVDVVSDPLGSVEETEKQYSISGVSVPNPKATVELFKTCYTRLTIVPNLIQNMRAQAVSDTHFVEGILPPEENGVAIQSARFADDGSTAVSPYFSLYVIDDRTLEIVPTRLALDLGAAKSKELKSSYQSSIIVSIDDVEFKTAPVTLTVKKTLPNVKVSSVKFNSYFADSKTLSFSGGEVTDIEPLSYPSWLSISGEKLTYVGSHGTSAKSGKGSLVLLLTVNDWAVKQQVKVNVSYARTAPKLSFSPTTVTLKPGTGDCVTIAKKITPEAFSSNSLYLLSITEGSGKNQKTYYNGERFYCYVSGDQLIVRAGEAPSDEKAHTYKVTWMLNDTDVKGSFTVKTLANKTAVTLSVKASGAIDSGIPDSPITLKITPKNYHVGSEEPYYVEVHKTSTKPVAVDEVVFSTYSYSNSVVLTEQDIGPVEKGYTYYSFISIPGVTSNATKTKLSTKFSDADKVSIKASLATSGKIDVIRPNSSVVVKPKITNCYTYVPDLSDLIIYSVSGKKTEPIGTGENNPIFDVVIDASGNFVLTRKANVPINVKTQKFSVSLQFVADGKTVATKAPVKLPLVMGSAKLSVDPKTIQLLKNDKYTYATVKVSVTDSALSAISQVRIENKFSAYYDIREIGNGTYELFTKSGISLPKSGTVKLEVLLEGNGENTANAVLPLTVKIS